MSILGGLFYLVIWLVGGIVLSTIVAIVIGVLTGGSDGPASVVAAILGGFTSWVFKLGLLALFIIWIVFMASQGMNPLEALNHPIW